MRSRIQHLSWQKKCSRFKKTLSADFHTCELLDFPAHSLGREPGYFLDRNNYTLMAQFESHDVFHVLLEYQPTVLDEARMQYCLVGSGKKSLFSLGTCLIAILFYPEYAMDYKQHYQRGKTLKNFSYWDFETLLDVDIFYLKKVMKVKKVIDTSQV